MLGDRTVRTAGVGVLVREEGRDVLETAALAGADLPACTDAAKKVVYSPPRLSAVRFV